MRNDELDAVALATFLRLDRDEAVSQRSNRLLEWALNVFCWDGLLPIGVMAIPTTVSVLFPNLEVLHVVANVVVPIFAFFIRCYIGSKYFHERSLYTWQFILFVVSILYLIFLEALLILFHEFGKQAQVKADDWMILGKLFLIYLAAMAISLFPFRVLWRSGGIDKTVASQRFDS